MMSQIVCNTNILITVLTALVGTKLANPPEKYTCYVYKQNETKTQRHKTYVNAATMRESVRIDVYVCTLYAFVSIRNAYERVADLLAPSLITSDVEHHRNETFPYTTLFTQSASSS